LLDDWHAQEDVERDTLVAHGERVRRTAGEFWWAGQTLCTSVAAKRKAIDRFKYLPAVIIVDANRSNFPGRLAAHRSGRVWRSAQPLDVHADAGRL